MGAPEQSVLHMISATDVAGKMHGHLFCIKKKMALAVQDDCIISLHLERRSSKLLECSWIS